jgi:type III secretory pathway component EscS
MENFIPLIIGIVFLVAYLLEDKKDFILKHIWLFMALPMFIISCFIFSVQGSNTYNTYSANILINSTTIPIYASNPQLNTLGFTLGIIMVAVIVFLAARWIYNAVKGSLYG